MLKSTGIVRRVDDLGRIVIPIELRRTLNIGLNESLEIFVDQDKIVLKKYEPSCAFCGNADETTTFKNKLVCKICIKEIAGSSLQRS